MTVKLSAAKDLDAVAKVQLIVTTHSPWLPISVEAIASDADCIFEFDLDESTIPSSVKLERKPITIKGSIEDWSESSTFDMPSSRSTEAETAINAAAALLDLELVPTSQQIQTVEQQLSAALSDTDAFWARWEWWKASVK